MGPCVNFCFDHFAHGGCRVDQVETFAFHDLQRHGCFAVKTCGSFAIFKGQFDFRQIAQCDHTIPICFDGQVINILHLIKAGWDFHRKCALCAVDFARGDQLVVVAHNIDQFACSDVIAFKSQGVDCDLDHFIALAGNRGLKHRIHAFDLFLQILGNLGHRAFRNLSR